MKYIMSLILIGILYVGFTIWDTHLYQHDLDCVVYEERGYDICRDLAHNMRWEWIGHSTLAPGFRVTPATVRDTWCDIKVGIEDMPALRDIVDGKHPGIVDWRLENGVSGLMALIQANPRATVGSYPDSAYRAPNATLDEAFIKDYYTPSGRHYVLREACSD